jgi:16S rRNA (uracil1498-N3)-methyltransferase
MRLIRVHVAPPLARGARVTLTGTAAAHVSRVLRLAPGDEVTLFNGDGADYPSRIARLARGTVEVEILGAVAAAPESPLAVRLAQGIARGERMDFVVQKATELGVAAIQPLVMARSVVRLDAAGGARRQAHWHGIAIAACEQCGRARVPQVAAPLTLSAWLERPAAGARRLQLAASAAQPLVNAAAGTRDVELLVGPEGGFDEAESAAAQRAGYLPCRLGPRTLRSETAALAALAVLQAVAGDFGGNSHL